MRNRTIQSEQSVITLHLLFMQMKLNEIDPTYRINFILDLKKGTAQILNYDAVEVRLYDGNMQGNKTASALVGFSGFHDSGFILSHEAQLHKLLFNCVCECYKRFKKSVTVTTDSIKLVADNHFIEKISGDFVASTKNEENDEFDYRKMALRYSAEEPKFSFDRLVLTSKVRLKIEESLIICQNRSVLFGQWGLSEIMSPSVVLNFYGDSGTGKTMAADAIADKLNKKIIRATYADIESKYHGEGPKMLKAIFLAAQEQQAVLFIDEADSMLSSRLSNVSSGSEQAINSMRSQLLICLEDFDGIIIFATNKIENYDQAFLTRLTCIEIERPDAELRQKIWRNHLYPVGESKLNIPLTDDISLDILSESFDFCGRDIRNAVKVACTHAVVEGRDMVSQADLVYACERILGEMYEAVFCTKKNDIKAKKLSPEEEEAQIAKIAEHYRKKYLRDNVEAEVTLKVHESLEDTCH